MTDNQVEVNTKLTEKNKSPLIVRKYNIFGWPMYIGVIYDGNLSPLDEIVNNILKRYEYIGTPTEIQQSRNMAGEFSDAIIAVLNTKNNLEGLIVLWYLDKLMISSAYGDFMNHEKCCFEFYSIVNIMTKI